jgi:polysaccharide export outer membrane protein
LNNKASIEGIYAKNSEYILKADDNLYVKITGNNSLVASAYRVNNINVSSDVSIDLLSHTIDEDGTISLPLLGEIKVGGMTISEAKKAIKRKASELYKKPSIIVKMVNKSVTLLGEFKRPGKYTMLKNKMSIFEAMGLAGDLSDYGNRKTIQLIRQVDGKEKMVTINITDSNIMNSDYYWILPNDILYVPPRNRVYGTKTLSFTGILGTSMSVISTVISIVLLLR